MSAAAAIGFVALFGISATLDAFESSFPGHDEYAPFVQQLRQQVDRLRELMHDLLDFGRPTPTVPRRPRAAAPPPACA